MAGLSAFRGFAQPSGSAQVGRPNFAQPSSNALRNAMLQRVLGRGGFGGAQPFQPQQPPQRRQPVPPGGPPLSVPFKPPPGMSGHMAMVPVGGFGQHFIGQQPGGSPPFASAGAQFLGNPSQVAPPVNQAQAFNQSVSPTARSSGQASPAGSGRSSQQSLSSAGEAPPPAPVQHEANLTGEPPPTSPNTGFVADIHGNVFETPQPTPSPQPQQPPAAQQPIPMDTGVPINVGGTSQFDGRMQNPNDPTFGGLNFPSFQNFGGFGGGGGVPLPDANALNAARSQLLGEVQGIFNQPTNFGRFGDFGTGLQQQFSDPTGLSEQALSAQRTRLAELEAGTRERGLSQLAQQAEGQGFGSSGSRFGIAADIQGQSAQRLGRGMEDLFIQNEMLRMQERQRAQQGLLGLAGIDAQLLAQLGAITGATPVAAQGGGFGPRGAGAGLGGGFGGGSNIIDVNRPGGLAMSQGVPFHALDRATQQAITNQLTPAFL